MAFTFGGTTGDDISWTESSSPWGATQRSGLICGWWYPTSLAAGNTLWGVGPTNRASIATTTSEIDIFVARTTNSQDQTVGLGLTVNRWHFIAILASHFNTGAVDTFRVWRGYDQELPVLIPLNGTPPAAGAGNGVTTATQVTIGNLQTTGTVSFVGDIGRFDYIVGTGGNGFLRNTAGTISADEERQVFEQMVVPIWQGKYPTWYGSGETQNNLLTHTVIDLQTAGGFYPRSLRNGGSIPAMDASAGTRVVTASGVTPSARRVPFPTLGPVSLNDRIISRR